MWTYAGEPEIWDHTYPGGHDGVVLKYPLTNGHQDTFTAVKISDHARMKASDSMTTRALLAVDTQGRSEVERYLSEPLPARVIEVGTMGDPRMTLRADQHQAA